MKVLVTGGTGFIGQKLLNGIACEVRLLSRTTHSNYSTVVCDFENDTIPQSALSDIDVVFHLAGFAHDLGDASKIKDLYKRINIDVTIRLARLAVESNVKKFIFVSSVKAGGSLNLGLGKTEQDQGDPDGIYGKTKREAELKLFAIGKEGGMHVSVIRPALVYGPNVKGNLRLMLLGIKKGWFLPLPEIGNKISMIHVDDLVRVILLAAEDDRANGEIFIATDGVPHSSREIYNAMCSVLGKSIPSWSVPKFVFIVAALLNFRVKYKLNKLLGNEFYSSSKLEALGFKAQKTLMDMNETIF
jgi:nucleoside-diphosphate-sugar epimerase